MIQDYGSGMDDYIKTHAFDKFFQGDSSRSKSGSGLGLAIVYRIIAICRGTIEIQSIEKEGSTFMVSLPTE